MKKKLIGLVAILICLTSVLTSCYGPFFDDEDTSEEASSSNESSLDEDSSVSDVIEGSTSSTTDENDGSDNDISSDEVLNNEDGVVNEVEKETFEGVVGDASIADLYDYCIDSCVSIVCTVVYEVQGFFGTTTQEGSSLGSGFVIEGGYIVTNQHVVEDAKKISVVFSDGEEVEATLVGEDETCDIAVLKVNTSKTLYPVKLGDSDDLRIGEEVIAIGTPSALEFAGTLTYGVVSGLNRKIDVTDETTGRVLRTMYLIQTDATLNPGNSGGPLFNMKGEVVGINNMKLVDSYEGIGFSIPINGAMSIINALIEGTELPDSGYAVTSAYLGITGISVSDVRESYGFGTDVPDGVFVNSIERNSSAYGAGLSAFDIITKFQGVEVKSITELKAELEKYNAGTEVTMEIYRMDRKGESGTTLEIKFKLDKAS